ncbi:MAG: chitobiase/beta-hexosaminidase C-terminal domain-containing protein, partial [Muribaculaceae bacterium]|nr:chitobiase/beta-hexosaminidase C-terminal domain-containing protein [Muribaculaceae bacterium]
AIGEAVQLNAKDANFSFAVPAANQAAGTKYKIATANKYNAQITTLTFNGDDQVVEPPVVETKKAANIGAFLSAADATNPTEITSAVTAVYQNGRYLYVTDATGDLLVFGDLDTKYNNGDLIPAGITGKFQNFSDGLLQMSSPDKATFKTATAGTAVEPEELTVEEVATDMVNHYVVLKNVSIAATETNNNYTLSDETGDITLYNTFYNAQYYDVVEVLEGEDLNVEGFINVHSGVAQITPIRVWSASGLEAVATPTFNPASGTVEEGTEVTISCATEGASIYYTLDNSTPSAESTLYTAPIVITDATSIRAIAIKEGMANSAVANASYVVEKPFVINGDAKFNFEKPETLNPAQASPEQGSTAGINIDGIAFSDNGVTVEFSAGSTGTRLYYGFNTGVEARLYKTGTVTITAPEGNPITKIEFYGETGIGNLSIDGVPVTDKEWSSAEGAAKVVATAVANQETENGRVD